MSDNDRRPPDGTADLEELVAHRMQEVSGRVQRDGQLPAVASIRARGEQRRRRRTSATVVAASVAVIAAVTGASLLATTNNDSVPPATAPSSVQSPAPTSGSPTDSASAQTTDPQTEQIEPTAPATPTVGPTAGSSGLFDGSHAVDLRTADGNLMAPNVEGGVSLVAEPEAGGVSTSWVITPAGNGTVRLVTVTLTDGRPSCLHALPDGVVGLDFCDDGVPAQVFDLTGAGAASEPPVVTFGSGGIYVAVVDGSLTTTDDPARAATFTVADGGPVA